ncbi:MAG: hypothetical protein JSS63_02515 [Bacteroidetes bacterium]|nr:hypothetical protein [Bacteroidota bacterium]MBX7046637.1 hypothetical protein [Ignavibacteria bacterium]
MKLVIYYVNGNPIHYEYSNLTPEVTQNIDVNDIPHSVKRVYHYMSALPGKRHVDDTGLKIPDEIFMVTLERK